MTTKVKRAIGPLIHAMVREIDRTQKDRWEKHLKTCEICKAAEWSIKRGRVQVP